MDKTDRSPRTRLFYIELERFLLSRSITQEVFRVELNKYLPTNRQIKSNHGGTVQISKWISTTSQYWSEPRSEITLAAQEAFKSLKKQYH